MQIAEYEQYQSNEVIELTKMIQAKQVERISRLTVELKDDEQLTEKLAELQEKLDKEALTRRKQVNSAYGIFPVWSSYQIFQLQFFVSGYVLFPMSYFAFLC